MHLVHQNVKFKWQPGSYAKHDGYGHSMMPARKEIGDGNDGPIPISPLT